MNRTRIHASHPTIDTLDDTMKALVEDFGHYRQMRTTYILAMNGDYPNEARDFAAENMDVARDTLKESHRLYKAAFSAVTQARAWG